MLQTTVFFSNLDKYMIWLYQNLKEYIGLDGSEFKRCEFDEALSERFAGH